MNISTLSEPVASALTALSQQLALRDTDTFNSRRIFHGRGRVYPELEWCCIDFFAPVLLVTFFREPCAEWQRELERLLADFYLANKRSPLPGNEALSVVLQRRFDTGAPYEALHGAMPEQAYAQRGDLRFKLSFEQQNVGYFLDIEPARKWLEENCQQGKVLNLFSYTCTFSVVALASQAQSVVNIDMSRRSLSTGRDNHHINGLATDTVKFLGHDILKSWGKLKKNGPYNIVIIDPPSFQKGSFVATKDYVKVLRKMPDLVAPGGSFLACLNAPEIKSEAFESLIHTNLEGFELEQKLCPNEDFPESDQGRELKMLAFRRN